MAVVIFGIVVLIIIVAMGIFTVSQQTAKIVERFGKFNRIATSGLNIRIPFVDRVATTMNLRIQQLDIDVETKTKDNVFVKTIVSIQYQVMPAKIHEAYYKLNNPTGQITSYVFDVVRARIPNLVLDDVFEKKSELAVAVRQELSDAMSDLGYEIVKTLVTDIEPDAEVKRSMNSINAARRDREAMQEKAEADRIVIVKRAEAEAESKKLQGQGIADQRLAIMKGLKDSVEEFIEAVPGADAQSVIDLINVTNYLDVLKDIGKTSNTIMLPHNPKGIHDIESSVRDAMLSAGAVEGQAV
ncbi:MAG: SPFH domain-containing protein [Lentisphaeraceae bacterium]|nr:SPFH domain-containing protein [Lentisphaeraceae bacterium]